MINPFSGILGQIAQNSPFLKALQSVTGPQPTQQPGVQVASADPAVVPGYRDPMVSAQPPVAAPTQPEASVVPIASQQQQTAGVNLEAFIRERAAAYGIDPDIAVRVAKSEGGLKDPVRQSSVMKNGRREPSYGPFQLLVGGGDTGFPTGLGNRFMEETGLDPRNPANALAGIDYALKTASKSGWGQWFGAKNSGIGNFAGIGGNPAGGKGTDFMTGTVKGPYAGGQQPQKAQTTGDPMIDTAVGRVLAAAGAKTTNGQTAPQQPQTAVGRVLAALGKVKISSAPVQQAPQAEAPQAAQPVNTGEARLASVRAQIDQKAKAASDRAALRKQQLEARAGKRA